MPALAWWYGGAESFKSVTALSTDIDTDFEIL